MITRRWAAVLATVALLAVAAPASALTTVEQAGSDAGGFGAATATCPKGQKVISGGFRSVDPLSIVTNRRVSERSWLVESVDADPAGLTAYANCSTARSVTEVSTTLPFDEDGRLTLTVAASCPSGKRAIAGGWAFDNRNGNSPVYSSRPTDDRTWTLKAFRGNASSLTAYTYCAKGGAADFKVVSAAGVETTGSNPTAVATASCKAGQELMSGGFNTVPDSDFYNQDGPDFFYRVARRTGSREFRVKAMNWSSMAGTPSAYAVCAR